MDGKPKRVVHVNLDEELLAALQREGNSRSGPAANEHVMVCADLGVILKHWTAELRAQLAQRVPSMDSLDTWDADQDFSCTAAVRVRAAIEEADAPEELTRAMMFDFTADGTNGTSSGYRMRELLGLLSAEVRSRLEQPGQQVQVFADVTPGHHRPELRGRNITLEVPVVLQVPRRQFPQVGVDVLGRLLAADAEAVTDVIGGQAAFPQCDGLNQSVA